MTRKAWGLGPGAWGLGLGAWGLALAVLAANEQAPRPSRIISLIPAVTEMLFAMDAGDQVVGISSFDAYPPEATTRTRVGALLNPDFERILSLKPDLVVLYVTQQELASRLERARVPTFAYRHTGLADISTTIRSLGDRIGRQAEASRVARELETGLDDVGRATAGRPRPRVALVFGRETGALRSIFVSGGAGFLHDLVETAGGRNAFDDVDRESLQVSSEAMLARAPEVIVEMRASSWDQSATARELEVWRTLPALPAVRANRIHLVADDRLFIPGPRVVDAARVLARTLHPGVSVDAR